MFGLPIKGLRAIIRVRLCGDDSFATGEQGLNGNAGRRCQAHFLFLYIIKGLKCFEPGQERLVLCLDFIFDFDG